MLDRSFRHPLSNEIADILQDLKVLYSVLLDKGIETFFAMRESTFATEYNASVFFMYRNFLSIKGGIIPVIDTCSEESAEILLRCVLEYNANLKFILQKNTQNRALAYQVYHAIEKIKLYKKYDESTQEGKAFQQLWQKDDVARNLPFPTIDSTKNAEPLLRMLEREPFSLVKQEYYRTKNDIEGVQNGTPFRAAPKTCRSCSNH